MDEPETTLDVVSETGDVDCVIKLQGDIDLESLPRLRGALRYAIEGHPDRLIVDLTDVDTVEVSGLAVLAGARHRAGSVGTSLLLQAPNATTVDLIAATG
jgi:anti-sigma B factor antagonist